MIPQHNCNNFLKIINNNRKKYEIGVPLSATHPNIIPTQIITNILELSVFALRVLNGNGEITQRTHARPQLSTIHLNSHIILMALSL